MVVPSCVPTGQPRSSVINGTQAALCTERLAQGHLGSFWCVCKYVRLSLKHKIAFPFSFLNSLQSEQSSSLGGASCATVRCF